MTTRRSEPIDRENLAVLKLLRRAGLAPTVVRVTTNAGRHRSR
jgi:hypothetical protein